MAFLDTFPLTRLDTSLVGKFPAVYLLWDGSAIVYVGRADIDGGDRISQHLPESETNIELIIRRCDKFSIWQCRSAIEAYQLESELYHIARNSGIPIINRIHPASPTDTSIDCETCASERAAVLSPLGPQRVPSNPSAAAKRAADAFVNALLTATPPRSPSLSSIAATKRVADALVSRSLTPAPPPVFGLPEAAPGILPKFRVG